MKYFSQKRRFQHASAAEWVQGCGGAAHGFSLIAYNRCLPLLLLSYLTYTLAIASTHLKLVGIEQLLMRAMVDVTHNSASSR
jgi:hypothetical protein